MSLKWPYSEATSGPPQEAPPQVQGTSLILSFTPSGPHVPRASTSFTNTAIQVITHSSLIVLKPHNYMSLNA